MSIQRLISLLMQISGALCLSCVVLAVVLQQDPWVKQQLTTTLLKNMQELVHVPVSGKLVDIDVLTGIVMVDALHMNDKDHWSFSCERMVIKFSWFDILKRGYFLTDIIFYKPQIYSRVTRGYALSIEEPISCILKSPAVIPCLLRKCYLSRATLRVVTADTTEQISCILSGQVLFDKATVQVLCDYSEGTLLNKIHESRLYNSTGTFATMLDVHTGSITQFTMHNKFAMCIAGKQYHYTLMGKYKNNKGYGELKALDQSIICKLTNITRTDASDTTYRAVIQVQARSAALLQQVYSPLISYIPALHTAQADIRARFAFSYTPRTGACTYTGTLSSIIGGNRAQVSMPTCVSTVHGNATSAQASFELSTPQGKKIIQGNLKVQFWPFTCEINGQIVQALELSKNISLEQATGRCVLQYNHKNKRGLHYKNNFMMCVTHKTEKLEKKYTATGSCVGNDSQGIGKITLGSLEGKVLYTLWPLKFEKIVVNPYVELIYNTDTDALEATLESKIIKQLGAQLGYELQGDGVVKLSIAKSNHVVMLTAMLEEANMRLKGQYNMAKAGVVHLEIDPMLKKIVCKDSVLELHKGCIKLTQATVMLEQGTCVSAHVPLIIDNCLISWQKDFFGTFSGVLVGVYTHDHDKTLKGFVTLDRSHLRSNVLSLQVQQRLLSGIRRSTDSFLEHVQLALVVRTGEPIYIKTSVLDSKARMDLQVQGTLVSPEVSGIIELLQGTLLFAYKPLYITHARLYLTPGQFDNALVELTARNKIKKYTVTVHASGPLQQPVISIDSSPALQEEQIITLLLAGTEEGSLYAVVPAMIMHTLENFLFGAQQEPSQIQRSLKLLLQPLKHVRIKPDSSGPPGSFKGGVEIDLTDKLRASVHSALHTPQDTQVEVEYAFSDDISVKGVKDERGLLSGELEMRWKF